MLTKLHSVFLFLKAHKINEKMHYIDLTNLSSETIGQVGL